MPVMRLNFPRRIGVGVARAIEPSGGGFPVCLALRRAASSSTAGARTKTYFVSGESAGVAATVTARQHTISTGLPRTMGGKDVAPQPVELFLAALVGCETATAVFVAQKMRPRFPLGRICFDYSAERDERGALAQPIDVAPEVPARLQHITGRATVHLTPGSQTESKQRLATLKEQVEARCPIASMVTASGCTMDVDWVLAEATCE
eukprot:TRINITY_DN5667_c0_g2_i4.p1 TRINITY_DN5667_c0_g2~~TRINITY_DN5667_c0_g2_i4.p1  ORF type:complete len:206 (+),score=34.78 TRINITY_DN5667_c0_g2_i4:250-867(+)